MPGYKVVELALIDVMDIHDDYYKGGQNTNLTRGDYRILNKGHVRNIILMPGAILGHSTAQFPRRMRTLWVVNLELYIRFNKDISEIVDKIADDRQVILDHIDQYPTLNGATGVVFIKFLNAQSPDIALGENRNWWRQTIQYQVEERYTATIAE